MADVFLSHASADGVAAGQISTLLTESGYSVWWDRQLNSGVRYEEVIKDELLAARVVLVVWTATSAKSDWVYSEARRGHQRHVLVQVRDRSIEVDDLPAPFDAFHCPLLDDHESLVRSVASTMAGAGLVPAPSRPEQPRTLLVTHHADADAAEVARQQPGFDDVCTRAGGEPFRLDGPWSAASFVDPDAAATAAGELRRTDRWSGAVAVHTGLPTPFHGSFIGMDLTRAQCLAESAHPGQAVLSVEAVEATRALSEQCLHDLGWHSFAELTRPEHVFELLSGDGSTFPPLMSLGSAQSLPRPATSFVGRTEDLTELSDLFRRGDARIVTLTGPGGIGKTRLALAVAGEVVEHFSDGVFFVALESAVTAAEACSKVARAMGLPSERADVGDLARALGSKSLLLVLDNLEQLPDIDAVVERLAQECPSVAFLSTSRRPLHVLGEHVHGVGPMEPETAVTFFERQARLVNRSFQVTDANRRVATALCDALDGIPLALELAAARSALLSPGALLERLGSALDLSARERSRPDRHRTLRATLQWSYDLLDEDERRTFRCLSLFTDGASLGALEAVTTRGAEVPDPLSAVETLVEAALAHLDPGDDTRIRLLNLPAAFAGHELTRHGERDDACEALTHWCTRLVSDPDRWVSSSEEAWVRTNNVIAGLGDMRTCLAWLLDEGAGTSRDELVPSALRVAAFYAQTLRQHAHRADAQRWLTKAIELGAGAPSYALVHALHARYVSLLESGDAEASVSAADEAARVLRSLPPDESPERRRLEFVVAVAVAKSKIHGGDLEGAVADYTRLWEPTLPDYQRARLAGELAYVLGAQGHLERSMEYDVLAADLARAAGWLHDAVIADANRACSLREAGRVEESLELMRGTVPALLTEGARTGDVPFLAEDVAATLIANGRLEPAALLWGAAAAFRSRFGIPSDDLQDAETAEMVDAARAELGQRWSILLAEGATLDLESAMRDVLRT